MPFTAGFRVVPYWTNVRFGRWEAILDEPRPPASNVFLTGAWHYARGTALAATGRLDAADAELAALEALMARPALDQPLFSPNSGRAIMAIGPAMLAGEIAAARGAFDAAIAHLDRAVRLEDALVYTEPAEWAYPTRHALGAVLLEAGRAGEAETVFWEDLRRNRENGWALTGLVQALRAQGKQADAEIVDVRRRAALARADVALPGSRFGGRAGATTGVAPTSAAALSPASGITVSQVRLATGVTLEYAERGPHDAEPIILLHGVTDSWRSFEPLMPHLPADVRVLAVTQRGHGGSSRPDDYRYAALAGDVAGFMDALGLPRAVIVGHSMGSLVALRFAIDRPDRTAGLVLLGALPTIKGHPEVQAFWDTALAQVQRSGRSGAGAGVQESTIATPIAPAQLDLFVAESLRVPARVWRETFREFLAVDFSAEISRIAAPALIVAGGRDTFSRRQERDALAAALRQATVVDYPDTGHALHWEEPARVGADIGRFLARVVDGHAGGNGARSGGEPTSAEDRAGSWRGDGGAETASPGACRGWCVLRLPQRRAQRALHALRRLAPEQRRGRAPGRQGDAGVLGGHVAEEARRQRAGVARQLLAHRDLRARRVWRVAAPQWGGKLDRRQARRTGDARPGRSDAIDDVDVHRPSDRAGLTPRPDAREQRPFDQPVGRRQAVAAI